MEDIKHVRPPFTWMYGNGLEVTYTYNHTMTLLENVYALYKQIKEITKSQNDVITAFKEFTLWAQEYMEDKIGESLTAWLEDGTLENIINTTLFNNKVDKVETYAKDFTTLSDALSHALSNSGILNLEPKTYELPYTTLELVNNLTINGNGATLVSQGNDPLFRFVGKSTSYIIQGITEEEVDLSNGGSNIGNSVLSCLTLDRVDELQIGDVMYIKQFDGPLYEMSTIKKIDGLKVFLSRRLMYTYTSTVCEKLSGSVTIDNVNFDTTAFDLTKNNNLIQLYKTVDSTIRNITVIKGNSVIVEDLFNYGLRVENSRFSNLINKIGGASNNLGYGIVISGSYYTTVSNCEFRNLRHGVATGGYNYGATIDSCVGIDCTNSPFDTHELGKYTAFLNCRSFNTVKGSASSATGFIIRADDVLLQGCQSVNDEIGVYIFAGAKNTIIKDCVIESRLQAIRHDGVEKEKLTIDGLIVTNSNISSILLSQSDTVITRSTIAGGLTSNNGTFLNATNSVVKMKDVILDGKLITTTGTRFFIYLNNTVLTAYDLELIGGNDTTYITYNTGDLTLAKLYRVVGTYKNSVIGANTRVELMGETQTPVYSVDVAATGVQQPAGIRTLLNQFIVIKANPTNATNGLNFSYPGTYAGQSICVTNESVDVTLNLTGSLLNGTRTVPPKRSYTVVWNGTNWA